MPRFKCQDGFYQHPSKSKKCVKRGTKQKMIKKDEQPRTKQTKSLSHHQLKMEQEQQATEIIESPPFMHRFKKAIRVLAKDPSFGRCNYALKQSNKKDKLIKDQNVYGLYLKEFVRLDTVFDKNGFGQQKNENAYILDKFLKYLDTHEMDGPITMADIIDCMIEDMNNIMEFNCTGYKY